MGCKLIRKNYLHPILLLWLTLGRSGSIIYLIVDLLGEVNMQLLVCVLNKTSALETILRIFSENNIHGATVLTSKGMAHILSESEDFKFMDSLIKLLNPENSESKTFFLVLEDDKVDKAISVIDMVTGGLDKPDTGVAFTIPVLKTFGFGKQCTGC